MPLPQRSSSPPKPRFYVAGTLAVLAVAGFLVQLSLARAEDKLPAKEIGGSNVALALDRQLIAEAKASSEIMANLTYLSDIIGPRLTGSANLKRANEWAAEKMKSYGLTNVQLEPWELPVAWERGTAYARIVEPDNGRTLTLASMGWTPGTNGKVTGDVVIVTARNVEELKPYQGKLKNAVVLRGPPANVKPITDLSLPFGGPPSGAPDGRPSGDRPGNPPARPGNATPSADRPANPTTSPAKDADKAGEKKPDDAKPNPEPPRNPPAPPSGGGRPSGFDTRRSFDPAFRREMAEFFKKEGVAALLQDASKPHGLLNISGSWSGRDRASASDPLPSLSVAHEHYALLHRLASRPSPARTRIELEVVNKFVPGPHTVYNTVGEIRGSEKPDEFVVVGAHLDSWDLGQGTTDNGTGTCIVLETARLIAKCGVKPKRTIRFALFTGEEQGLHGSKAYVQRHKEEMDRTSICLIHDIGTGKIVGIGLQGREPLKPIMERELVALKDVGVTDINTRSMGGSDHLSFEQAGVPGLIFQQDPAEYRLTHHSQTDTLDKAREPDLIQGAQVMAVMALRAANLDQLLPREKKLTAASPAKAEEKAGATPEKK